MKGMIGKISVLVHKFFWLAGILGVVMVLSIVGAAIVLARGETDVFPGTTAPGSHQWWDINQAEAQFCNQCHNAVATELAATNTAGTHPITNCLACHGVQGQQGHVAVPAKCVDCHANRAAELTNDAHASILGQLGETEADASWTCKACHTYVDVDMTTTTRPPLQLQLGP